MFWQKVRTSFLGLFIWMWKQETQKAQVLYILKCETYENVCLYTGLKYIFWPFQEHFSFSALYLGFGNHKELWYCILVWS